MVCGVSKLRSEYQSAAKIPRDERRIISKEYLQNLEMGKVDENVVKKKKGKPLMKQLDMPAPKVLYNDEDDVIDRQISTVTFDKVTHTPSRLQS